MMENLANPQAQQPYKVCFPIFCIIIILLMF
jgi:hypothetical protein